MMKFLKQWKMQAVIVVFVFALAGCGGGSGGSSSGSSGSPDIALSAAQFDFGNVPVGTSADRSIQVQNLGDAPLVLEGTVPSGAFQIFQSDCPNSLGAGAICTINIRFSPAAQTIYTGSFTLNTNDSDAGTITVPLLGSGKAYNVAINHIQSSCPKLQVVATVTAGAANVPVTGLAPATFSVKENGVAIPSFTLTTPSLPLSVGIVLDYSTSMVPFRDQIEASAVAFVGTLAAADEAEVVKFNNTAVRIQPYTTDKALLTNKISEPFSNQLGTALFNAVKLSIDDSITRSNLRKAVIALSDFNDNRSSITLDQLIVYAFDNGIPVFTIGIGAEVNTETMQRLATETRGQFFLAPDSTALAGIYSAIKSVLSTQYLIEYDTPSGLSGTAADAVIIDINVNNSGSEGEDSRDGLGC